MKKKLEEQGLCCWLDEEQMKGNINAQMTKGIDGSAAVVVFVTARYVTKVAGEGTAGEDDNCALLYPRDRSPTARTPEIGARLHARQRQEPNSRCLSPPE